MVASADSLVDRARRQTGLDDLGPGPWRLGLERLLDAVQRDAGRDADAVDRIEKLVVDRLAQRLRIEGWLAAHPDDVSHPVEGPLAVIGLPRTGTTALHYLLSIGEGFRYLRSWEVNDPIPPPELATEHADPRRPASAAEDVRHIAAVDGPAEDWPIHALAFDNAELTLPVPSFSTSWREWDHAGVFPYHERVLRVLHSRRPPQRWLLKLPSYLFMLPDMVAHYPEVRFSWTHRDPADVVASTCSTIASSRRRRTPTWDPPESFGRDLLEHWGVGMQRALAARDALGERWFVDVAQRRIELDPVGVAEQVYDHAGMELDAVTANAMATWADANRRGSRGEHRYSLSEFGLTAADVTRTFTPYLDRFGHLVV